ASFLEEFNQPVYTTPTQKATNEMEMVEHPSVRVHFDSLVPKFVSYEEFWQRYYYRCHDLNRIVSELKQQDEQQQQERAQLENKDLKNDGSRTTSVDNSSNQDVLPTPQSSFGNGQDRLLQMAYSLEHQIVKDMEKEDKKKEDNLPNLNTTFDSSLSFGTESFNVIPVVDDTTRTQTSAEPASEVPPQEYRSREEESHQTRYEDDESSFGSLPPVPDYLSEVMSVVTNPDQIHRYPESPDNFDDHCKDKEEEEEPSKMKEHSPFSKQEALDNSHTVSALDSRLSKASIFILKDHDEQSKQLVNKIIAMGGRVTQELKGATHALWISPNTEEGVGGQEQSQQESWEDFKESSVVAIAEKCQVPILEAEKWLPRIARLEFEEHWSDVNCEDFHPENATKQAKSAKSPKLRNEAIESEKEIGSVPNRLARVIQPTPNKEKIPVPKKQAKIQSTSNIPSTQQQQQQQQRQQQQRRQIISFAKVALLWTMALLLAQWQIYFPSKAHPMNPLIIIAKQQEGMEGVSLFRYARIPSDDLNNQMNAKVPESWYKKLVNTLKIRRRRRRRQRKQT
ncbi:MAG: hypothetical protein SGBAC_009645, partial [Bacillariaceae sp.]